MGFTAGMDAGEHSASGRTEERHGQNGREDAVRVRWRGSEGQHAVTAEMQLLASLEVAGITAAPDVLGIEEDGYVRGPLRSSHGAGAGALPERPPRRRGRGSPRPVRARTSRTSSPRCTSAAGCSAHPGGGVSGCAPTAGWSSSTSAGCAVRRGSARAAPTCTGSTRCSRTRSGPCAAASTPCRAPEPGRHRSRNLHFGRSRRRPLSALRARPAAAAGAHGGPRRGEGTLMTGGVPSEHESRHRPSSRCWPSPVTVAPRC